MADFLPPHRLPLHLHLPPLHLPLRLNLRRPLPVENDFIGIKCYRLVTRVQCQLLLFFSDTDGGELGVNRPWAS